LEIKGIMTSAQPGEIVGKVAGVKIAAGEGVLFPGVPYLELCARVAVVPGITDGIGRLSGFLQVGHIGAAARNRVV